MCIPCSCPLLPLDERFDGARRADSSETRNLHLHVEFKIVHPHRASPPVSSTVSTGFNAAPPPAFYVCSPMVAHSALPVFYEPCVIALAAFFCPI